MRRDQCPVCQAPSTEREDLGRGRWRCKRCYHEGGSRLPVLNPQDEAHDHGEPTLKAAPVERGYGRQASEELSIPIVGRETLDDSMDGLSPLSVSESDFIDEESILGSDSLQSTDDDEALLLAPQDTHPVHQFHVPISEEIPLEAESAALYAAENLEALHIEPELQQSRPQSHPQGNLETFSLPRKQGRRAGFWLLLVFVLAASLLFADRWRRARDARQLIATQAKQLQKIEEALGRVQSSPELALLGEQLELLRESLPEFSRGMRTQLARICGYILLLRAEALHWGIESEVGENRDREQLTRAAEYVLREAALAPTAAGRRRALSLRFRLELLRGNQALAMELLDMLGEPSIEPLSPLALVKDPSALIVERNEGVKFTTRWESALALYSDPSLPPEKAAEAFIKVQEELSTPHRAYWALLALRRGAPAQLEAFRAKLEARFPHSALFSAALHQPAPVDRAETTEEPTLTLSDDEPKIPAPAVEKPRPRRAAKRPSGESLSAMSFDRLLERGEALLESGKARRATRYFEAAHQRQPRSPTPLAQLAWAALELRSYAKAERYFNRALANQRGHGDSLYGLAYLYERRGNREEAKRRYQLYLEKHPSGTMARLVTRKLERL
ncbi:MAG: tetratricopeptide repeat protein [Myxococcota bacterium]|nr:tetratricopeptide repeat protein [Myxococcota bacterium]